jgi:membrane-bound lytic murein transglycosylase B/outer membrane murein-binding lipoprotein Lpp
MGAQLGAPADDERRMFVIRPRPAISAVCVALVAISALMPGSPAGSQETTSPAETSPAETSPAVVTEDDLLAGILVESVAYRSALDTRDAALATIAAAERRIPQIEHELEDLESASRQLSEGLPRLRDRIEAADSAATQARSELTDLAVLRYVFAGSNSFGGAVGTSADAESQARERDMVIATAAAGHSYILESAERLRTEANLAVQTAESDVVGVDVRIARLNEELAANRSALANAQTALPGLEADVEAERSLSRVTGSDLTLVAVDAYLSAATQLAQAQPECGMRWELLAGIGRVESRHGTYRGATVGLTGDVSPSIIGIALDGSRDTAVIGDSDGGALDGDPVWDRAVGPMQFIPSTWRRWGHDGNGDAVVDPQNLYDAALSAAHYLCARGSVIGNDQEVAAILSYNRSMAYVSAVQGNARSYDDLNIG